MLITQGLILQPEAELNIYSKPDIARLVGSGLSDIDTGLRLRYEISRKSAPYVGASYESAFGQTGRLISAAGERSDLLWVCRRNSKLVLTFNAEN